MHAVALVVVHGCDRRVDRDLVEVRSAESRDLRVARREWMRPASSGSFVKSMPGTTCAGAERDLLGLGEEVVRVAIEHETSDAPHGYELFGNELRRIEHVEAEPFGIGVAEDLDAELPFGEFAGVDRFPEIAAVEIGIGAGDLHRFVPDERMRAEQRRPVELHECRIAAFVDEPERVDAEPLASCGSCAESRDRT